MPNKTSERKQTSKSTSRQRKAGGGRRRKDLGTLARTITWYYFIRGFFQTILIREYLNEHEDIEKFDTEEEELIRDSLVWYLEDVAQVSDSLDDMLDTALAKRFSVPPRTFHGIRYKAVDPGVSRPGKHKIRLVDIVAKDKVFEHTREIYDSLYWELLTKPRPDEKKIAEIISFLLNKFGLYRATDEEAIKKLETATDKTPYKPVFNEIYKNGIVEIGAICSLDALALLGALYRESIYHNDMKRAMYIYNELSLRLQFFDVNDYLDKDAEAFFYWLPFYRLFADRWTSVPDPESLEMARNEINIKRKKNNDRLLSPNYNSWRVQALALRFNNRSSNHRYPIIQRK